MARSMQEIKDLFVEFLLENNCYSQAQINFMEDMKVTVEEWIENYTRDPKELLNYGFYWFNSPEGWSYWNEIDIKWRKVLEIT